MGIFKKWIILLLIWNIMPSSIVTEQGNIDETIFLDSDSAKIKQSNECTSDDIDNNIQCFQEVPKEKYEVTLGSAVTLRCIVRNQHGKVQWRAVPVLLGYDRNIPGRPRYRYVGSVVKGEHHLEIQDLVKEDAGIFECQVQPVGDKHPLLRRKTELVILVRPTDPQIFYLGVKPHNDQVIIRSSDKDDRSVFLCISLNGQPAAIFKWFISNKYISNGVDSAIVESVTTTRSKMNYMTRNLKDGDIIKCRVSNRATEKHHDPAKRYLDKDVEVILQTPPGEPYIQDMTEFRTEDFSEGDIFRCTCVSSPPGKPEGSIIWRMKFPTPMELYNNRREDFTVKDVSPQYYQQQINDNRVISKLELPSLTGQYHGAKLSCVAINPVTSYQKLVITFKIKYPPSEVKISTSDGSMMTRNIGNDGLTESVILGHTGEEKSITCTTAVHYSEAKIEWNFHYNPLMAIKYQKEIPFQPQESMWNEGPSYRRNSTINVTIDKKLDKCYIVCQVWSGGKRVEARVKLDIIYPPEKPIITGYNYDRSVKLNHAVELTCSTTGGNPLPNLQWFKDSDEIESNYPPNQMGNQKTLKLKIIAKKEDNNIKYFCQAKSVSFIKRPLNSEEFRLIVYFPPDDIAIMSLSGPQIEEGNIITLQCVAGESNPPAIVRWKINRCGQMMTELGRRPPQKNCEEQILLSTSQNLVPGNFGGKKLKSNVEIRTTWKDHMDYVDCEIYNPEYGTEVLILRKRMQLNVTFSPKFEGIMFQHIIIEENRTQTFNFEPFANPPVFRYQWFKGTIALPSVPPWDLPKDLGSEHSGLFKTVAGKNSMFIINTASPFDMGNYTLVATNERGEQRLNIYLDVTYRPIISGGDREVVIRNRQNADLECSAKANPANPFQSYRWVKLVPERGLNDISNSSLVEAFSIQCNTAERIESMDKSHVKYFSKCNSKSKFEMSSLLIVYELDRNDVGIYMCIVNNGIGSRVTKKFELIKYFTPQILALPKFAKAAGSQGETVTLTCYIRSEPQPDVLWTYGRFNYTIKVNSKYNFEVSRVRIGLYVAQLRVIHIQRSDHGRYYCTASNNMGSDIRFIDVTGSTIPDVPIEVQIVNKTVNSATVSWVQGFDGGSPQTFQVRWKENKRIGLYRYEDVASDDTRTTLDFIINGLQSDSIYHVSINARNSKHGKSAFSKDVAVATLSPNVDVDQSHISFRPTLDEPKLQDNTVLFIVAASVFGFVIFVVNVLVIIFVLKRRRQRCRTAKFESRYNNPKSLLAASNGLILSREDNTRDSNFIKGDAVELYPRGLDDSQVSHQSQHLHSLRRSIPDDQKTFSSFETGSDDAREDLLRRQKEFGCCAIDPNSQRGPMILAYDPLTNVSYYAPFTNPSTPIHMQPPMYDQDTLSTLLSPVHEGSQRQLVSFMNMVPYTAQRDSSSCGSMNSAGGHSIGSHPPGHYVLNNISPCGSINATDSKFVSHYVPDNINYSGLMNGSIDRHSQRNVGSVSSGVNNNAPYRPRVMSPAFLGYGMTPQQRDSYANELRKAQLSGNIIVNPVMFSRNPMNNSQVMISQGSHLSSPINLSSEHFSPNTYVNFSQHPNVLANTPPSTQISDVPVTFSTTDNQICQKYKCNDNQIHSSRSIENINHSVDCVNSTIEDSNNQVIRHDSPYLPRPDLI